MRALPDKPHASVEELLQRHEQLKGERSNFDTQWQEVKDLLWPDGGDFTKQRSPGEKTNLQIFDANPTLYVEQGASVFEAFLMPRTQRWQRTRASDPELMKIARVKKFFEDLDDKVFDSRYATRSNFEGETQQGFKSTLGYGNNCIRVMGRKAGGITYKYRHIGQTWIDTDADDVVDTTFYAYELTARAAVKRWGENAPQCARDVIDATPGMKHRYLECVYPNPNFVPGNMNPKHMAFVAFEISVDSKVVLEQGGYHELPDIWSRYSLAPGEKYGRGPAMLVLPSIKTLQEQMRVHLRSGQKAADPPLLTIDDGVLGRGSRRITLNSGGIIPGGLSTSGSPNIVPLLTGARLDITHEMMMEIRELIRKAFHVDVFELLVQDRVQMTATEVMERAREKSYLLGSAIGRQQSELLGPMIEREISILQRQGKVGPMPPELIEAKGDYTIEYESDATRMQKSSEIVALGRTLEVAAPFFQNNPSLLELWNPEVLIRSTYETAGGSSRNLRSPDEYGDVQEQIAQARQEADVADAMPAAAKGVRDIAEARKAARSAA